MFQSVWILFSILPVSNVLPQISTALSLTNRKCNHKHFKGAFADYLLNINYLSNIIYCGKIIIMPHACLII